MMVGCPAGALSPENVDLMVVIGPVDPYDVATSGLQATTGGASTAIYSNTTTGMGTSGLGSVLSIESGTPNEMIVFQFFRSNGVVLDLGAPESATSVMLSVGGLPTSLTFDILAEDTDGTSLGAMTAAISDSPIDVSASIPGDIHKLTIDATSGKVSLRQLDYTHSCLGYTP